MKKKSEKDKKIVILVCKEKNQKDFWLINAENYVICLHFEEHILVYVLVLIFSRNLWDSHLLDKCVVFGAFIMLSKLF